MLLVTKNVTGGSNKKCTSTKDNINTPIQNNINSDRCTDHFDIFWNAGLPKINKSKAIKSFEAAFKKWKLIEPSKTSYEFLIMIASDIKKRLEINQFGFEQLHPTTYLNNQRWEDEIISCPQVNTRKSSPPNNSVNWIDGIEEEIF